MAILDSITIRGVERGDHVTTFVHDDMTTFLAHEREKNTYVVVNKDEAIKLALNILNNYDQKLISAKGRKALD